MARMGGFDTRRRQPGWVARRAESSPHASGRSPAPAFPSTFLVSHAPAPTQTPQEEPEMLEQIVAGSPFGRASETADAPEDTNSGEPPYVIATRPSARRRGRAVASGGRAAAVRTRAASQGAGGGGSGGAADVPLPSYLPKLPMWAYALGAAGLLYAALSLGNAVPSPAQLARGAVQAVRSVTGWESEPPQAYTQPGPTPTPFGTPRPTPTTPRPTAEDFALTLEKKLLLTDEQIGQYITGWESEQFITPELLRQVDVVNRSLYFRLTGRTFGQSGFVTKLLTKAEYEALYDKPGGTWEGSAGTIGMHLDDKGRIITNLYVNYETPGVVKFNLVGIQHIPTKSLVQGTFYDNGTFYNSGMFKLLFTLAHETGNAEAGREIKPFFDLGITDRAGIDAYYEDVSKKYGLGDLPDDLGWRERESMQALYRSAVFHYLEETGVFKPVELTERERTAADEFVDMILQSQALLPMAAKIAWYRALNDPETNESLKTTGRITSKQAMRLFNEFHQRDLTLEGIGKNIAESTMAIRTAPQYAQQIKDAIHLSKRPLGFIYEP